MQLNEQEAAYRTWHIGIWCIVMSGALKFVLAPFTELVRRVIPRAGLLGSLVAIALVLISFMPLMEIFGHPLPGMIALVIVLTTLVGRIPLPGRTPGTLGALLVAGTVYYVLCLISGSGYDFPEAPTSVQWFPNQWLEAWQFQWLSDFDDALPYLPIALPFAIGTVVAMDRLHRERRCCWRHLRHSDRHRGRSSGNTDRWIFRWRDPNHTLHRISSLQSHGRSGGIYAGHGIADWFRGFSGLLCLDQRLHTASNGVPDSGVHRP